MRASIIVTLLSLLLKTLAELENGIESDVIPRQVEESGGGVQKRDGIPLAPQDLPPPKKEEPKKDEPNKDEPEQGIPVAPQDLPPKKEAPPAAPEAPKEEQGIPVTPQDLLPKKEAPLAGNTNKEEEGEVLVADDRVPKNEDEETTMAKASNIQLPPSLKLDDFDTVVSERLTLVEFFSRIAPIVRPWHLSGGRLTHNSTQK